MIRTAILVDGGYYRRRAEHLFGVKTAQERADELERYCKMHLDKRKDGNQKYLYRIFYYDCPPCDKVVYHPFLKRNIHLDKNDLYKWMNLFLMELKHKRKFALRMGRLSENGLGYTLKPDISKKLFSGKIEFSDITEKDFRLDIKQKTMDMKLGTDVASMALKRQVEQMVLIAGDSDFVPAAKLARREGIDFILDPMGLNINEDLSEHIDGIRSNINIFLKKKPSHN